MNKRLVFLLIVIFIMPVFVFSKGKGPKFGIGVEGSNSGIGNLEDTEEDEQYYGVKLFWLYGTSDAETLFLRPSISFDYYRQVSIPSYVFDNPPILKSSYVSPARLSTTFDFRVSPKWIISPYWETGIGILINNDYTTSFLLAFPLVFGLSASLFDNKLFLDVGLNIGFLVGQPTGSLVKKIIGVDYVF